MNNKGPNIELSVIAMVSIVGTFVFAFVAYVLIVDSFPDSVISIWNTWDTHHYLNIAKEGYSSSMVDEKHLLIVFFPLYPFLIKIFSLVFQDHLLSALLISNIAYIFAVFYLYKLVHIDFEKEDALRSIIYFSIFPTAYFLHAAYTESLFLALTLASFYYARKDRWALSGVIGMLAAATRITGIILLPVLVIEYLSQREYKKENIRKDILWILVIAIGFVLYLVLNYITYGDPLKFLEIQGEHWSKSLAIPTKGFLNAWVGIFGRTPEYSMSVGLFEIVFSVLGLILIIYSFFRLRFSYSLYALATWLIITSTSFWQSIPRYTLTIFPIFIALAIIGRRKEINYIIIFLSLIFYALFLSLFVRFRWAF
jgi:Gpi18-like mannosyltransferase